MHLQQGQGHRKSISAPVLTKKTKQILQKFKKFQFFCVVDNLMRETRSKFQVIWTFEQLSVKKTNRTKTVHEQ